MFIWGYKPHRSHFYVKLGWIQKQSTIICMILGLQNMNCTIYEGGWVNTILPPTYLYNWRGGESNIKIEMKFIASFPII